MRRKRPLAERYAPPRHDGISAAARRGNRGRHDVSSANDTRLSNPLTATTNNTTTSDGSPQPRRPSNGLVSSTGPSRARPMSASASARPNTFAPPRGLTSTAASSAAPEGSRPFYDEGSVLDPPLQPLPPARVVPAASAPSNGKQKTPLRQSLYHQNGFRPVGERKPQAQGGYPNRPAPTRYIIRQLPAATHALPLDEESPSPPRARQQTQHQQPFHAAPQEKPVSQPASSASVAGEQQPRPQAPVPTPFSAGVPPHRWTDERRPTAAAPQTGFYKDASFGIESTRNSSEKEETPSLVPSLIAQSTTVKETTVDDGSRVSTPPRPDKKDYGFMTPPALAEGRPPQATSTDIHAYFAKSNVFSLHDTSARENAPSARRQKSTTARLPTSASSALCKDSSAIFWGFERAARTTPSSASASSSPSSSPSSAAPSLSCPTGCVTRGIPSHPTSLSEPPQQRQQHTLSASAHPYEVARAAPKSTITHTSFFTRHGVKASRVLQSYLAQHQVRREEIDEVEEDKSEKHRAEVKSDKKRHATRTSTDEEQQQHNTNASALTARDQERLQDVVEAAERAAAAAAAAAAASQAATVVKADTSTASEPGSLSIALMTQLIQSIIHGKADSESRPVDTAGEVTMTAKKKAETGGTGQGPCSTLISNAGDPLALNVVVDYLKKKAARLAGENEELWCFLRDRGPVVVGDREPADTTTTRRHHRVKKRKAETAARRPSWRWVSRGRQTGRPHRRRASASTSTTAASNEGRASSSSRSTSSSGTSLSSITGSCSAADDDSDGHRGKAVAKRTPQTKPGDAHSIHRPRRSAKVESLDRTASRSRAADQPRHSTREHANTTATTATTAKESALFHTPARRSTADAHATPDGMGSAERQTATNTLLMSPSLSSSTTVAGGEGSGVAYRPFAHHNATPATASRSTAQPLSPAELERRRRVLRYSAEKDELYSFMQSVEEEEEAAIRAGRGADYGFNDAPFHHYVDEDTAAGAGDAHRRRSPMEEDSVRMGSSATQSRYATPNPRRHATATNTSRTHNASTVSGGGSSSARFHKHVQAGRGGLDTDDDDAFDKLTETESEYVRRWRRGENTRRVPPRTRDANTNPASEVHTVHDRDSSPLGDGSVLLDGGANANTSRATVVTLHTYKGYTRRTVQRLQAYVDRLEDTRQRLKEAVSQEDSFVGSGGRSAMGSGSGVHGVPPLYPHHSRQSHSSSFYPASHANNTTTSSSPRARRKTYFRAEYADPDVDATLNDMDDNDPVDVKFVIQDDGIGSVSKQVIDEEETRERVGARARGNSSAIFPPSSTAPSSAKSSPTVTRQRAGMPGTAPGHAGGPAHNSERDHHHHGPSSAASRTRKASPRVRPSPHAGAGPAAHVTEHSGPTSATSPTSADEGPPPSHLAQQHQQETGTPERRRRGAKDGGDATKHATSPLTRENLDTFRAASADRGVTSAVDARVSAPVRSDASLEAFLNEAVARSGHDGNGAHRSTPSGSAEEVEGDSKGQEAPPLPSAASEASSFAQLPHALSRSVNASRLTSTPTSAALQHTTRRGKERGNARPEVGPRSSSSASRASSRSASIASARFGVPDSNEITINAAGTAVQKTADDKAGRGVGGGASYSVPPPAPSATPRTRGRPELTHAATAALVEATTATVARKHAGQSTAAATAVGEPVERPDSFFSLDGLMASPTATLVVNNRVKQHWGSPGMPPFSQSHLTPSPLSPMPSATGLERRHPSSIMAIDREDDTEGEDRRLSRGSGSRRMSLSGHVEKQSSGGSGWAAKAAGGGEAVWMGSHGSSTPELSAPGPPTAPQGRPTTAPAAARGATPDALSRSPTPVRPAVAAPPAAGEDDEDGGTFTLHRRGSERQRAALAVAAARSVSSPPVGGSDPEDDSTGHFHAALSASPVSDTDADELTSPP